MKRTDRRMDEQKAQIEIQGITEWLRRKVEEAGTRGLVLGVSGGIDSAVVAALIKRAFPESSLGLILPCFNSKEDVEDAHLVCDHIGIQKMVINLEEPHLIILDKVNAGLQNLLYSADSLNSNRRMSDANLRARLRMSTLYTVANFLNYLVVGTDNLAEMYMGYFTKYGDGGVDLLPLSNFTKREVRTLARVLEIPEKIIKKAPSAGLWVGQTDEEEMGVTYEEIDDYLEGRQVSEEAQQRIERLHRNSEHKRNTPPRYIRV